MTNLEPYFTATIATLHHLGAGEADLKLAFDRAMRAAFPPPIIDPPAPPLERVARDPIAAMRQFDELHGDQMTHTQREWWDRMAEFATNYGYLKGRQIATVNQIAFALSRQELL